MDLKDKKLIFAFSLLIVCIVSYLIFAQHYDPFFDAHLTLSKYTIEENYLAYRPFDTEERGDMQIQVNNISTKFGLTLLLSILSLVSGMSLELFPLFPLGILILFLVNLIFIRKLFQSEVYSTPVILSSLFILLEISFICSIYNLNTHAWGFFIFLVILYLILDCFYTSFTVKKIIALALFMLTLSTIYYSLQFALILFLLFFSLTVLVFRGHKDSKIYLISLLFALLVILFSFSDDFFKNVLSNFFLNSNNFKLYFENFILNIIKSINIFDGSYTSVITSYQLESYNNVSLFFGFIYYFVLFFIVSLYLIRTLKNYLRTRTILVLDRVFISLIFTSILHFLLYLYFNQFVTYLILFFFSIISIYFIFNYLPKKKILFGILVVLVLLKLISGFYLDPNYDRSDYRFYSSEVVWACENIPLNDSQVITDLYFGEKLIYCNYDLKVYGFYYLNEDANNIDIYYESDADLSSYNNRQTYLVMTTLNTEVKVPLFYGISSLIKPFESNLNDNTGLNKIYSSNLGSIYWFGG